MNSSLKRFLIVFTVLTIASIAAWFFIFSTILDSMPDLSNKIAHVYITAPAKTCWSGAIGNSTRDGCGPATIDFPGEFGTYIAVIQKQGNDRGVLQVRIYVDEKLIAEGKTASPFGVVSASGSNP